MTPDSNINLSPVEQKALQESPFAGVYPPTEKLPSIVVETFPDLGKLTALRFIEWVLDNPEGVVSLPTGKTPEYFIKWVNHLLNTWEDAGTRTELEKCGISTANPPNLSRLRFVQIDEFYPIDPSHEHSFYSYVNEFYIGQLGLDPERALLINCREIGLPKNQTLEDVWPGAQVDLSLRHRAPETPLEELQQEVLFDVDEWCRRYENRIREMGGIGFFLGGIGPDGHIAFNVRGSDHHSTTRLAATNYETQAAAATDLGGMALARDRRVITIGLGTITANPDCTAIVIAAGETKAPMVAEAIQNEPDVRYPATALHKLDNARFYLTEGAAKDLREHRYIRLSQKEKVTDREVEKAVIDLSVEHDGRIADLEAEDFAQDRLARQVLEKRAASPTELAGNVRGSLLKKMHAGSLIRKDTRFLHTEPHHDDLMLGYLPHIVRHTRDPSNIHYFATLTSGFTAVTDSFVEHRISELQEWIHTPEFRELMREDYFTAEAANGRNRDIWQYLDGVAAQSDRMKSEGSARRLLRDLTAVYNIKTLDEADEKLTELTEYFKQHRPGEKDSPDIQELKGRCREWEAECLWGYFGWNSGNVLHLRLGFYTGDIFTEQPAVDRDVAPFLETLERVKPDIVTVALDPEASGPDTHYKVLQVVAEGLKQYAAGGGNNDIKVWGYRNVWYRFHPAEANLYIPVSLNMFSIMRSAFMNTFNSQKNAPFPSYEHDGPFCELARKIQVEQYHTLKTCLGREWFHNHPSALIRATRGLVFLREMELDEFLKISRELREIQEKH
ncbi:MAG: glucosamine-6-phosphate deaminase [Candidatus Brocadiia bacterium]